MLYRLIILNGVLKGQRHSVGLGPLVIGSGEECSLRLTGDEDVAREHARIEVEGSGLRIRDLGTVNRILVNKREVSEAPLSHGDVLAVGRTELWVQACVEADIQGDLPPSKRKPKRVVMGTVALAALALAGVGFHAMRSRVAPIEPTAVPVAHPALPTPAVPEPVKLPVSDFPSPVLPDSTVEELRQLRQALADLRQAVRELDTAAPAAPVLQPVVVPPEPAVPEETPEQARAARIGQELQAATEAMEAGREDEALARVTVLLAESPDVLLAYELRARIYEKQGETDKAIGQWAEILRRGGGGRLGEVAGHERTRLTMDARRVSGSLPRTLRIRSHDVYKFQGSEEYDEMRLLNVEIQAPPALGTDAGLQVLFFDRRASDGVIRLTGAIGSRNRMPLNFHKGSGGALTVSVPYVVPRGMRSAGAGEAFYGYILRVYSGDRVEDEAARPESLLTGDSGAVSPESR